MCQGTRARAPDWSYTPPPAPASTQPLRQPGGPLGGARAPLWASQTRWNMRTREARKLRHAWPASTCPARSAPARPRLTPGRPPWPQTPPAAARAQALAQTWGGALACYPALGLGAGTADKGCQMQAPRLVSNPDRVAKHGNGPRLSDLGARRVAGRGAPAHGAAQRAAHSAGVCVCV